MELMFWDFADAFACEVGDEANKTQKKESKEIQRQMKIETAYDNMIFMFAFVFIHA